MTFAEDNGSHHANMKNFTKTGSFMSMGRERNIMPFPEIIVLYMKRIITDST